MGATIMTENIMNNGCVSVIIPVYNTKKYLEKCLDSVCGQSYSQLEIIVINDGSTDGSEKILQKYSQKDSRFQVITQENRGLSAARNIGLEYSSGEYVLFLDSDDWIDRNTIDTAIHMIMKTESDIVLWSYIREYSTSSKPVYLFEKSIRTWNGLEVKSLYQQLIGPQKEQLREPQKVDSLITAWGKLYKKSIIGDVRFVDTKIIGTEDALFNIQVFSQVKKAVYIPNTFSHYRKTNSDSLTKKYKNQLVYQWRELYRRIRLHLNSEEATLECYNALSNRVALGLIGLGLNLAEDKRLNFLQKRQELRKILRMSHYQAALASLPMRYFCIHWKVFFICAKHRWSFAMCTLLLIMNWIRGC